MKTSILAITASTALFSSFSTVAETIKTLLIIEQHAQVAGYYQHQFGNTKITALLDSTNFMSPTLFKHMSQNKVQEI